MYNIKENYLYNKMHFWLSINKNSNTALCGISDYAQSEYGNIVFIELPKIKQIYKIDQEICIIESVKSVSDLYSPISGKILKVNNILKNHPKLINESPCERGWIFIISINNYNEIKSLFTMQQYKERINA